MSSKKLILSSTFFLYSILTLACSNNSKLLINESSSFLGNEKFKINVKFSKKGIENIPIELRDFLGIDMLSVDDLDNS